jgi:hypothetical protein
MIYITDKYLGAVSINHAKPTVICLSLFYVIWGLYRVILLRVHVDIMKIGKSTVQQI